jgi:hypothetical protein
MDGSAPHHSVHRIVLPSGRKIEVVRFEDESKGVETRPLHVCPSCRCELVQPLTWSETEDERWELELGCPNCEWSTEGVFDQGAVEDLEEHLDEGLAAMLADLHRLTQANMVEEVDRFVAALHADLILPEDF